MHIAVDLDDVTVDFWRGVLDAFTLEFGGEALPDMHPWGEEAVAFSKNETFKRAGYKDWWGWLREREWLWSRFPAVDGAIGGIKVLRHQGHYLEAVTSKPVWAEHNVWKWLGHYRPPFNRVTIITNGQEKVDFTDADVIIDDKLSTIESFREDGREGIWFNRQWEGADEARARGIYVAESWERVLYLVGIIEMEASLA